MTATQFAAFHDPVSGLTGIVIPDSDSQLTDTSFNPPGGKQIRVSIAQFKQGGFDLVAAMPELTPQSVPVANAVDVSNFLPADYIALSLHPDSLPVADTYRTLLAAQPSNVPLSPNQLKTLILQAATVSVGQADGSAE